MIQNDWYQLEKWNENKFQTKIALMMRFTVHVYGVGMGLNQCNENNGTILSNRCGSGGKERYI